MRRRIFLRMFLLDSLSLLLGVTAASLVVFGTPNPAQAPADLVGGRSPLPMVWFLFGGLVVGSWLSERALEKGVPRPSYGRAVAIALTSVAAAALSIVFTRTEYFSRSFIAVAGAVMLAVMLVARVVARSRPWTEPLLVVTREKKLVDDLMVAPHADIIGVIDPASEEPVDRPPDGVTIAVDLRSVLSEEVARFVSSSNLAGFPIRSLVDVYEEHTGRMAIVHLAEGWELQAPVDRSSAYASVKRLFDVALVTVASPVVALLCLPLAVVIRVTSPGPAIFTQTRVGMNGRPFTIYKFRTMVADAEAAGPRLAVPGDPRLTAVGRWLRRFRLDELPQLWNVARGDLSLVGPRPEQPLFVEQFARSIPFYRYRHLVRPGLTGWAQVNYGYADDEADTVEKLTFDLYYVKHMSVWLDLHIFGKSIWTVLSGFGAQ